MNVKELWMQTDTELSNPPSLEWAEKFAALVAAAEREACAQYLESVHPTRLVKFAAAIRARGSE